MSVRRIRSTGAVAALLIGVVLSFELVASHGTPTRTAIAEGQPITPNVSPTPGPSPVSMSQFVLYDNGLATGVEDDSFGLSAKDVCDGSVYHSPPCSYAITYSAWGALNLHLSDIILRTLRGTTLRYAIHPNGQPISDFGALLTTPAGGTLRQLVLSHNDVTKLPGGWFQVSLAMSALNPQNSALAGIQLKNATGASLRRVNYDDVELTGSVQQLPLPPPPTPGPTSAPPTPSGPVRSRAPLLPGEQMWHGKMSSFLFGSNDSEEWGPDNIETDPHGIIQSSMRTAHFTLERTFVFHYSLRDGHRTTIGTHPRSYLNHHDIHQYDRPAPPPNLYTGAGYEVERRIRTIEKMHMQCLVTFKDIWTTPKHNVDPNPFHKRIIDPATGKPETDLDFARKVVAYLGNRCNLYEIGNEPDLDEYTENGLRIPHMSVAAYAERWTEFVRALRKINPKAKFIGPAVYNETGNDCTYSNGTPFPTSRSGDCYLRNFLHAAQQSGVKPDAVSFHWYPCSNATVANCTATQWNSYAAVTKEVKGWVKQDLGRAVPVGITEWNFDPGGNVVLGSNGTFMRGYTRAALSSMMSAGLDFAIQFDTQSVGGYGALDMFDFNHDDRPKAQYLAIKNIIRTYRPKQARR